MYYSSFPAIKRSIFCIWLQDVFTLGNRTPFIHNQGSMENASQVFHVNPQAKYRRNVVKRDL